MNDMNRLIWAMAYILRDLIKHGAVDLSKLPEPKRQALAVLYSQMELLIKEVEGNKE